MTLLLVAYVAIMVALTERARRRRHCDHHRLHNEHHSFEETKKTPIVNEKSTVINVVA